MPHTLRQPKNPEFEKACRRGPDGRFVAVDETSDEPVRRSTAPGAAGEQMSRRDIVLVRCREEIRQAALRNKAESIALVGSVARDDDTDDSDFDFLVHFADGASLFDRIGLMHDLEDLLGTKVDVVNAKGVKGPRRRSMLGEAIPL